MSRRTVIASIIAICGLMGAGCHKEQANQAGNAASPAPAAETTAWWKTDGQTSQAKTVQLTGEPLPGWQKYAPMEKGLTAKGKEIFDNQCGSCHTFGKGGAAGPDLLGLTRRNTPEWTAKFIADPGPMVKSDPRAMEMLAKYLVEMPNLGLQPDDLEALNAYFYQEDDAAVNQK